MEVADLVWAEGQVADTEHGAAEAHGSGVFHGKTDSLGCRAEAAGAECGGGVRIAAQEKFSGRVEDVSIHSHSFCRHRADRARLWRGDGCRRV